VPPLTLAALCSVPCTPFAFPPYVEVDGDASADVAVAAEAASATSTRLLRRRIPDSSLPTFLG
jgi:hypothetical protein